MTLVHKILDFEVDQVDDAARTFWAVASTGQVDRQGDLIEPTGWDFANFLKNPVIPWAHDYAAPPVAKALALRVDGDRLLFQAQFPTAQEYAFADTIYQLYRGGYLRAFSVGFAPLQSELVVHQINGRALTGTRYLKQELYEISCVTLPANPQALAQLGRKAGDSPSLLELMLEPPSPAGDSPRPTQPSPAVLAAAKSALGRAALLGLISSRLRHHLGQAD
ncbi:MAG: HK97 family phage prohead protease [Desulfarculus sp.]|nr:HK97 family phage prohead protease [Desulfarculus sp.]